MARFLNSRVGGVPARVVDLSGRVGKAEDFPGMETSDGKEEM
ncbi:MAG: hypothetical protein OXF02_04900 [Simkaniaceae bacterium]|nr:hypothetical protein [Simkaniaceae bacterium]